MKYFFLCSLLFQSIGCFAQDGAIKAIDSLLLDARFDQAINQIQDLLHATSNGEQRIVLENKKAEILIRAGKFDEAEIQLQSIAEKSPTGSGQFITQANQGFLYLNQGRNDLALTILQEALANVEKENKQNTLVGAQVLSYLGNLYMATGKYAQAEEQLAMALAIRESIVNENSELIAASYNDLGLVYSATDANKALDHYEKALAIYEKLHGMNHPKIAIVNTNIGFAYRTLEFYGDAINNLESALTIWSNIYKQSHPTKAFVLYNLGQTYLKMRDEKSAEAYYHQALEMYQSSHGRKHPEIATVLNSIGSVKLSSKKFDEALDYFQQALIANVGDFNETNRNKNPTLEDYYNGNTLLFSLLNKAEALEARHFGKSLKFADLTMGVKTLLACDSLIGDLRQQISSESDKILLGTIATDVYAAGVRMSHEAGMVAPNKRYWFELAFYFAERSKSAVLLEAISDSNAKSFSGISSGLLEEEKKLRAEIALAAQKLSLKPAESEEKYLRELLFTLNRNYQTFIKRLETNYPAYYNLKFNVVTPSLKNLQAKVDQRTAILSYFIDEKNNRLYTFQITATSFRIHSHLITKELDRNLNGLRNSLVFNDLETYATSAQTLSTLLVPKNIPNSIRELIILPTGRLSVIPFEVLYSKKLKHENEWTEFPYLVKKYNIRYEFSAALILQKNKVTANLAPSIFLCAPVTFEHDGLPQLPGTKNEVEEIAKLFSSKNFISEVITGKQADEQRVKQRDIRNFSYVHLATHGIADESNPDLSRIYLSPGSSDEDGNLYAGEIYNMELNANLVTLSACQTGLGKIAQGEGVIGLSRALIYAGSKNIIVSFWSVADESTATLMKSFYGEMLGQANENFAEALRTAKLKLINESKFAAPFYWAPFVLIGY